MCRVESVQRVGCVISYVRVRGSAVREGAVRDSSRKVECVLS